MLHLGFPHKRQKHTGTGVRQWIVLLDRDYFAVGLSPPDLGDQALDRTFDGVVVGEAEGVVHRLTIR